MTICRERFFNRTQIANPVVDDCNISINHNEPFVLSTPTTRGFKSTACLSARAVALKVPSSMWWVLRPRKQSMCKLNFAVSAKDLQKCSANSTEKFPILWRFRSEEHTSELQ